MIISRLATARQKMSKYNKVGENGIAPIILTHFPKNQLTYLKLEQNKKFDTNGRKII